ncbi:uncharacterized protein LOC126893802 isoform X1 [Daktulosphaira vitifoliae]|uniref:uncharacterized protein LOC126893802 isoform X1 n=1 Tax=Daktulosphaira vitifoliae TaxID=58002 RepID=UPI0021AA2C03|nr:uncharacterized protein LOC126893802 isoform X1 [Daktulosphaira vitifoliae]
MASDPNTVAAILEEVKEDVHTNPITTSPHHPLNTNDANKIVIYVQDKNRFIKSDQHSLFKNKNQIHLIDKSNNLRLIAIKIQHLCESFGTISQGILAGIAFTQLFLGEPSEGSPLILMFFFLLSAVCLWTVLDIFDLNKCKSFKSKYIIVLFLNVLTALAAFACTTYDTAVMSGNKVETKISETWSALNCCRCYGALFGWVAIIVIKPKNQLTEFLISQ